MWPPHRAQVSNWNPEYSNLHLQGMKEKEHPLLLLPLKTQELPFITWFSLKQNSKELQTHYFCDLNKFNYFQQLFFLLKCTNIFQHLAIHTGHLENWVCIQEHDCHVKSNHPPQIQWNIQQKLTHLQDIALWSQRNRNNPQKWHGGDLHL